MVIGFLLIQNLILAEATFPYFLAFIFLYWGVMDLIASFSNSARKYWWLSLINGVLLCIIGFLFITSGIGSDIITIDFLVSIAFIYWGFSLCVFSYQLKTGIEEKI